MAEWSSVANMELRIEILGMLIRKYWGQLMIANLFMMEVSL